MKIFKITFYLLLISVILFIAVGCKGHQQSSPTIQKTRNSDSLYEFKSGSYNGIGKWYLGREIAHVMGFQGMEWLERPEREKEENITLLLKNMTIKPDDVIADIGAGSGYHVFKIAAQIQEGKVYAVDIQPEMLNAIKIKKKKLGIENIELIKGQERSANLPENIIDKILMVDVYHEFKYPVSMIRSMSMALKKNGELYLLEYRLEDPKIPIKTIHKMNESQAVKEFEANGFKLKQNIDNLPWQHCMVFVKQQ
jgi:precorrin-6B methylase 2